MACPYLPEDVMTQILKRLPLKSLLRFQCVSKSWFTLIRSPDFASKHLIFSNGRPSSESILGLDARHFWHLSGDNLESKERLDYFPLDYELFLYGCCDGIVCATVQVSHSSIAHFLWNPATREYKNLPPSCIDDFYNVRYHVGFGFDPKTDDYKVVRMVSSGGNFMRKRVEVYSMRNNSWREIQPLEAFQVMGHPSDPDRCMSGVLFWDCRSFSDRKRSSILLYDMGEEEFKVIDMPPSVNPSGSKFNQSSIAVLDELSAGHIDVWVMDVEFKNIGASSWVKQFTILYPCSRPFDFRPLGFTSRGELLCKMGDGKLGSYCPTDHKVRSLNEGGVPMMKQFVCYKESLAPLGGVNVLKIDIDPVFYMETHAEDVDEDSSGSSFCGAESAEDSKDEDVEHIADVMDIEDG